MCILKLFEEALAIMEESIKVLSATILLKSIAPLIGVSRGSNENVYVYTFLSGVEYLAVVG